MHLGLLGCLTKLGAKRAKLVQKFEPRSRVGIFRNKCTRSNPLDPKQKFWCISYHLGAFGTVWLPYETRWKTGRTSAKVRATKLRQNFSQRTHPIPSFWPEMTFWWIRAILVHPGPFGCFTKLIAKRAELVQKFVPGSRVGIFYKNAPDALHWTLN